MVNQEHVSFKAYDRSYFAILKKQIHALAKSAGFGEIKVGALDIVVAEMVTNLVKHAGGGDILVKLVEENGCQGIEIISIDRGPGMADISRMVSDGVSTKNTLGHGLGAMKRLSDLFQVYSLKNWGTIILIRIFDKQLPKSKKPALADYKHVVVAKTGEKACGDGFYAISNNDHVKLFLGDGLGHGIEAAAAVQKAGESFLNNPSIDPVEILRDMNMDVKKTRGLVAAVAVFSYHTRAWRICGIGNITTKFNGLDMIKAYTPYNGIVGLNVPNTLNALEIEHQKGQYLVMCSDGLKTKWDLVKYPAILRYDLGILCSALLKDHSRGTDDISVAACKINM